MWAEWVQPLLLEFVELGWSVLLLENEFTTGNVERWYIFSLTMKNKISKIWKCKPIKNVMDASAYIPYVMDYNQEKCTYKSDSQICNCYSLSNKDNIHN